MSSVEFSINQWLQDAIEYRLNEIIHDRVKKQFIDEGIWSPGAYIHIESPTHSHGRVEVEWSCYPTKGGHSTRERRASLESFTIAEVLRLCMEPPEKE